MFTTPTGRRGHRHGLRFTQVEGVDGGPRRAQRARCSATGPTTSDAPRNASFTGSLCGSVGVVEHADIWDEEAARRYDTPGVGMFAPEVLGPTVERLRALAGGGRTLEMAIGTGRVAVPLAEAGVAVAGIELCQPMVDQLRTRAGEERIPVVLGDMTTARADGSFSLVFLVFNGISNVLTQERQIAVFENAARHLVPGGRFVIELWVPDLRTLPPGRNAGHRDTVSTAQEAFLLTKKTSCC
jgi:SAM-dependent methyltransferase